MLCTLQGRVSKCVQVAKTQEWDVGGIKARYPYGCLFGIVSYRIRAAHLSLMQAGFAAAQTWCFAHLVLHLSLTPTIGYIAEETRTGKTAGTGMTTAGGCRGSVSLIGLFILQGPRKVCLTNVRFRLHRLLFAGMRKSRWLKCESFSPGPESSRREGYTRSKYRDRFKGCQPRSRIIMDGPYPFGTPIHSVIPCCATYWTPKGTKNIQIYRLEPNSGPLVNQERKNPGYALVS